MVVAFELHEKDSFEKSFSEARDTTDAGVMLDDRAKKTECVRKARDATGSACARCSADVARGRGAKKATIKSAG
jgi:hypothetical protein